MRRTRMLLLGAAIAAGGAVAGTAEADVVIGGYVYAPPSVYVAPPVVYHEPVYVSPPATYYPSAYVAPAPVYVHRPVFESYPVVTPAAYYAPGYTQVRDTGRRVRIDERVYTPFGVERHRYRFDRRDGDVKYRYSVR